MNERFYPVRGRMNDQPGNYQDVMDVIAPGAAPKRVTGGQLGGGFPGLGAKAREQGQSIVEMAFVLPLFLILVFAIIEMGRAWGAKQALTIAAREGARILVLPYGAGMTYTSETDVQNAALDMVRDTMNGSAIPVTASTQINVVRITPGNDGIFNTGDDQIEPGYTGGKRGERVGIQITYPFETPAPALLRMFENGGGAPASSVINMGVTCYMDHE